MDITVRKPTGEEKAYLSGCPTWKCDISRFDWFYDERETRLLIEGEVTVEYGGKSVTIKAGDYAEFPKGLSCVWNVKRPVKKYYSFG